MPITPPRRAVSLLVALLLGAAPLCASDDDGLQRGIALVNEGDFANAVVVLDAALRSLEGVPASGKSRSQAQLYLGVAYLELDQEVTARSKFREAVRLDPQMHLDPQQFSPQVIRTFEASRLEVASAAPAPAPPGPGSATDPVTPAGAPPAKEPRKKRSAVPFLIVGGGAAVAGVALAAGGGNGAATTSTTSATAGTTTTTTTTTVAPAPTTTTTQPPTSSCEYSMTPGSQSFSAQPQDGTCRVVAPSGCRWSVEATREWLSITGGASGSGSGTVTFHMTANTDKDSRDGRLRLRDTDASTDARCEIVQAGAAASSVPGLVWTGTLDVAGGTGQVVVDGAASAFAERHAQHRLRVATGDHRVEAVLVTADGRPGTWRFELAGSFAAGSLQPVAGDVLSVTVDAIVFRVSGRPGERIAFAFRTDR